MKKQTEKNSSMVSDEKELEKLGKEMEQMSTNKKVKQEGNRPDPIQHERNE